MLLVFHPPACISERRYILDVLLRGFLGLDYVAQVHDKEHVAIGVQGSSCAKRLIVADVLFQIPEHEWLTSSSLPKQPLDVWDLSTNMIEAKLVSLRLPVIYGRKLADGSYCQRSASGTSLAVDVFGSAFFMLTRYEEVANDTRDEHDRFPAHASLAQRHGFLERPIVNEYTEVLWSLLRQLWPDLQRKRRTSRVLPSHDVDWPLYAPASRPLEVLRSSVGDVVKRRDVPLALRRLRSWLQAGRGHFDSDPHNTFDTIMDLSEKHGLRSAFNFMAGEKHGRFHASYAPDDPWIRRLVRRIYERGHEIGLHTSYSSYRDPVQTKWEFEKLARAAREVGVRQGRWGGRQHYLRWRNPSTWQNWEDAGLDYDSTLTFADCCGFRCGTCYEYPAFNLETRRQLKLTERPLIAMEGSLWGYMGLSYEETARKLIELHSTCRQFHGDFTLLWHNTSLVSRRQRELYSEILQSISS